MVTAVFLVLVVAFDGGALWAPAEHSGDNTLKVGGDQDTEFSGTHAIRDEEDISGQAPQSFDYELDGRGLEHEIQKEYTGRLQIVLTGDSTRAAQRVGSSQATVELVYDAGSVSFSASSSGSGGQVSPSRVVSSSSSSTGSR